MQRTTFTIKTKFATAVALAISACAFAQTAADLGAPLDLRVIEGHEVDLGERSIFYNRVATPTLKTRPAPTPARAESERQPTAEELEFMRQWQAKENVSMFLSSTVYDREVTHVRWGRPEGEYVFWSSINFNYLRGLMDFETPQTRYFVLLGIGDETRADVERWNEQAARDPELRGYSKETGFDFRLPLPPRQIPGATATRSAYQFLSVPKTGIDPEVKAALDELHRHFDANRADLIQGFEESEERRLAQEQWHKDNPPQPKDTTIKFFPIKSAHGVAKEQP